MDYACNKDVIFRDGTKGWIVSVLWDADNLDPSDPKEILVHIEGRFSRKRIRISRPVGEVVTLIEG